MKVVLLAQTNVDLLARELGRIDIESGAVEAWIPGYGQVMQSVHDKRSGVYDPPPGAVMVFQDAADVFRNSLIQPLAGDISFPEDGIDFVRTVTRLVGDRLPGVTIVLNTIPTTVPNGLGSLEWNSTHSLRDAAVQYNRSIGEIAREAPGVVVLDYEALVALHGVANWYDRRLWYLARCRLGAKAMSELAGAYRRILDLVHKSRVKCAVVDLDNTCWGGVLGEDGMSGIDIGSEGVGLAYADFQRSLLNLRDQGVLLAVSSKNSHRPVQEAFRNLPGMVLAESDISAWRVNWNDKATSLREIAEELNIGLDSLAFIDDNPAERDLINTLLPEVTVVDLPVDPADYADSILWEPAFATLTLTQEDRERPLQYKQRQDRETARTKHSDLQAYLQALDMRAEIGELNAFVLPRVSQLTQKTNQFNLRSVRYTESELDSITSNASHRVFWLRLSDRFGDEGLIAVAIVETGESWFLDTFLMSCRVIGRGVEQVLLNHVRKQATESGVQVLFAEYLPNNRNDLVSELLPTLGFHESSDGSGRWSIQTTVPPAEDQCIIEVSYNPTPTPGQIK